MSATEAGQAPSPGWAEHRLDKLLRLAEEEAVDIRRTAEGEASALLQRTHTEIDEHERARHEDWERREAAVVEVEREAADALATARARAAELVTEAEREAGRIRGHAHNRAGEILEGARRAGADAAQEAAAEVERLERLREAARADVGRLLRTLDGIRDAIAYDLEAAAPRPRNGEDPRPSPAALARRVPRPTSANGR